MSATVLHGDCRELMRAMPDASVDSIVTDPPYDLTSIVKRFGKPNAAPQQFGTDGAFARAARGFMGQTWDGTGVAFDPATWAEALRVLKPGGYLLAFGGSRTYHRMACAIEDAGFELRDQIMWIYGSGFPKSHNLEGEHEGWGTALKPAHEPIAVARKPLTGTVAANMATHGVGALNIDACRVGYDMTDTNPATNPLHRKLAGYANGNASDAGSTSFALKDGSGERNPSDLGRWPANIIHDGSDEVVAAFPVAPGQLADARLAGDRKFRNVYGAMAYGRAGEASANTGAVGFNMRPGVHGVLILALPLDFSTAPRPVRRIGRKGATPCRCRPPDRSARHPVSTSSDVMRVMSGHSVATRIRPSNPRR